MKASLMDSCCHLCCCFKWVKRGVIAQNITRPPPRGRLNDFPWGRWLSARLYAFVCFVMLLYPRRSAYKRVCTHKHQDTITQGKVPGGVLKVVRHYCTPLNWFGPKRKQWSETLNIIRPQPGSVLTKFPAELWVLFNFPSLLHSQTSWVLSQTCIWIEDRKIIIQCSENVLYLLCLLAL